MCVCVCVFVRERERERERERDGWMDGLDIPKAYRDILRYVGNILQQQYIAVIANKN